MRLAVVAAFETGRIPEKAEVMMQRPVDVSAVTAVRQLLQQPVWRIAVVAVAAGLRLCLVRTVAAAW